MKVTEHPSLKAFNTLGVEASAALMLALESEEDLLTVPAFDPGKDFVLGGGSNVVFVSDIPGTVYYNQIGGKEIVRSSDDHVWIEAGAGENWHELVRWTLKQGLSGLENLSLIPGLAGAAPIQNIGAYGVELAAVLDSVTAWDLFRYRWMTFSREDCHLGYRDSRFKSIEAGRYMITSIRLQLDRRFRPQLEYAGLREELAQAGVLHPTPTEVSDAVVRLRLRKLPYPVTDGNAGSFFKNPVLGRDEALVLKARFPDLPTWNMKDSTVKLSAAWLIESCGLKGQRVGGAAVSQQHALVLVNSGSARGEDFLELANNIQTTIHDQFGVRLEPEPRIVNFSA